MVETSSKTHESLIKFPPNTPEQRLFWEVFFLFIIIITVGIFGRLASVDVLYTWIITIIFSINITIRFGLINEKGDWIFFLLGVLAGGGNDLMSMLNGVYQYTSITILPFLNGLLPLWMILFWGQIFLIFRKVFHLKWFKGEDFQKNGQFLKGWIDTKLVVDLLILIGLRIIIYNTFSNIWLPAALYSVVIGVRLCIFRPKKNEIYIIAILPYAFLFEGLMVAFGLYLYINPVFLGMPIWLFLWWLFLVPLLLKEIFDIFEYYLKNNKTID
ncbi:MAG TPA: hypothetical protein VMV49_08170 [Candidatus Deferrimicrobium sp.]|nr:hypothetical protein [Candidatus Deferrimicrobium sp.]